MAIPPPVAPARGVLALSVALITGAGIAAQQVRVVAPIGAIGEPRQDSDDDPGTPVEMFENPNLDRYLRRAQAFLERADYGAAIEVLQDVVEGRTVEVVAARPEDEPGADDGAAEGPAGAKPDGDDAPPRPGHVELDARNSVFSQDSRLYRPVSRLCHELLAEMPEVGIEIYRTKHEFAAEELLREAQANGSANSLEQVANRYFVTLPAGRAMMLLADRMMHEGRYRAAVQVLRDLIDIYPDQNRQRLGIRDTWCRFKIALCLRLAGEQGAAQQSIERLADAHPDESLRIQGQLESIADLPTSRLFARDTVAIDATPDRGDAVSWLDGDVAPLIPLWQFRFADPEPYRDPKPSNRGSSGNVFFTNGGQRGSLMPWADHYGPATWVEFSSEVVDGHPVPRATFLEHYRLRLCDLATGLILRASEAPVEPPTVRDTHPRARIAAVDHALLRPVEDELHRYVVMGYQQAQTTNSDIVLKATELVAYDRRIRSRVWSSDSWKDGVDGLGEVTFLAAPTVFGECLLLPALRRDAYTLECLDRNTGRPLWHTLLHAGGTRFFKAPGCPVEVQGGIAYVATNAGCVAAVDAFAGDLRWIRRYERYDTLHKSKPVRKRKRSGRVRFNRFGGSKTYAEDALRNFIPNDLVLHEGLLIVAPCDGQVMLALDLASGEPVWTVDGQCQFAPYGKLIQVVGRNDRDLFALSDSHLVCIGLDGGLVRWQQELPLWNGQKDMGRGRGVVVGSTVIVPNLRELLLYDAGNARPVRRLQLPAFDQSREPVTGSCNVTVDGPWLALGYQGGVEVYSTAPVLGRLAGKTPDPMRRAHYLTLSGQQQQAEQVLADVVAATDDAEMRARAGMQLLALVRRRATEVAQNGDVADALAVFDEVRDQLRDRALRLDWHLARVELCKAAGALRAHGQEQQSLYDFMESEG